MWINRGMPPPFAPSRLTPRQKDELIRDLARVVEAQAARIAALEARLAAAAAAKPANPVSNYERGRGEGEATVAARRWAMEHLYGSEIIFRARTELVPYRRELRLHVLCRSGVGAWLARIAPFEELFFDEQLVCGLTVREALEQLERRYATCCRPLVTLAR